VCHLTGDRQYTSAQAKERNRQAFQRRMAQKASRIHVAEQETSQSCGAEQRRFVLLRNFPFVGEVRLTVLTRFRERAIRSFRAIDIFSVETDLPCKGKLQRLKSPLL